MIFSLIIPALGRVFLLSGGGRGNFERKKDMTPRQKAARLRRLNKKIDKARGILDTKIKTLVDELEKISGLEFTVNDFAGDGIGIGLAENESFCPTYMSLHELIAVVQEKGTFSESDIFTSL